jgi:hypothetical protein
MGQPDAIAGAASGCMPHRPSRLRPGPTRRTGSVPDRLARPQRSAGGGAHSSSEGLTAKARAVGLVASPVRVRGLLAFSLGLLHEGAVTLITPVAPTTEDSVSTDTQRVSYPGSSTAYVERIAHLVRPADARRS